MAYICINYAGVLEANQILKKAVRELRELEEMCLFLSKTVAPEIQAHSQIEERLRNCCRSAQVLCQTADMVLETAEFGLAEYRNTEEKLMRLVLADDEIPGAR